MADVGGRPTVITEDVLRKLEEAFALGCTDIEACLYANIASSTFYIYQKETEGYLERKQELKETPILLARNSVINGLKRNPDLALRFLERRKKDEFAPKSEVEHQGGINVILQTFGHTDPLQLQAETLPDSVPSESQEISDSSMAPQIGQVENSPERSDTQSDSA